MVSFIYEWYDRIALYNFWRKFIPDIKNSMKEKLFVSCDLKWLGIILNPLFLARLNDQWLRNVVIIKTAVPQWVICMYKTSITFSDSNSKVLAMNASNVFAVFTVPVQCCLGFKTPQHKKAHYSLRISLEHCCSWYVELCTFINWILSATFLSSLLICWYTRVSVIAKLLYSIFWCHLRNYLFFSSFLHQYRECTL